MTDSIKQSIKILGISFGLLLISSLMPVSIFADQYGQYGTTPAAGQISLNKLVMEPATGKFVDNLGVNNEHFQAGEAVTYRIIITNNGGVPFGYVNVTDTLPAYLDFVSGPGDYNPANRHVTFQISNLMPGASQTQDIHARVVAQNEMPTQNGVFCIVNQASAVTNDNQNASDTAQLCIGKPNSAPVTVLPSTGYADYLIVLGSIATIGAGLALKKAHY